MTPHLDDVELVDALDGSLSATRDAHLRQCSGCTERLRSLRDAMTGLQRTTDVAVPEPSPFFWAHFSRRVHDAVRDQGTAKHPARWWPPGRIAALGAAAVVVIAAATTMILKDARPSDDPQAGTVAVRQEPQATSEQPQAGALDVEGDPDWALVRAVAEDLRWEDAPEAGIHARPGAADRVAVEMSAAERQELARLLEDELKRAGA
jgi:hypothetical protein